MLWEKIFSTIILRQLQESLARGFETTEFPQLVYYYNMTVIMQKISNSVFAKYKAVCVKTKIETKEENTKNLLMKDDIENFPTGTEF